MAGTRDRSQLPPRDEVLAAVARIAADSPALEARVFGSWARGTQTRRSDLDVMIVEETQEPFMQRLDRYMTPLYEAAGGPAVEVLVYAPAELEEMKERPSLDLDPLVRSVARLVDDLPATPPELDIQSLKAPAVALDKLYIPTRYPDALPGMTPAEAYTAEEAAVAISQARRLVEAVQSVLESECEHAGGRERH